MINKVTVNNCIERFDSSGRCIFCGKSEIENANKEHVIPQWLLKLTGDPYREWILGKHYKTKEVIKIPAYYFRFRSCKTCNDQYANLEREIAPIVKNLLDKKEMPSKNYKILLDWMDKVRIGFWLGNSEIKGEVDLLTPNFYINKRISTSDRILAIYFLPEKKDLSIIGGDSPIFKVMPSVFGIIINNILLVSASSGFMLSEAFGCPLPIEFKKNSNDHSVAVSQMSYDCPPTSLENFFQLVKPNILIGQCQFNPELRINFNGNYGFSSDSFLKYGYYLNQYGGTGVSIIKNNKIKFLSPEDLIKFEEDREGGKISLSELIDQIYKFQIFIATRDIINPISINSMVLVKQISYMSKNQNHYLPISPPSNIEKYYSWEEDEVNITEISLKLKQISEEIETERREKIVNINKKIHM